MCDPWNHVLVHQHEVYWCTEDDMSHDHAFSVTVPHLSNLSITKKDPLGQTPLMNMQTDNCNKTTNLNLDKIRIVLLYRLQNKGREQKFLKTKTH